jgi:hypothetical protein
MAIVDLTKLKPASAKVMVGDLEIEMKAASIERCERLFEVIGDLELEKVAAPIIALITQLRGGVGVDDVFGLIKANAESLIATLRPILGKQLAPALKGAVIAVLDTNATRRALTAPLPASEGPTDPKNTPLGIAASDDGDVERDDDGVYLGSRLVRAYLREEVTIAQAVVIVVEAMRVNDFRGALGNLWVGLTASTPAPEDKEAPKVTGKAHRGAKGH